RPKRHRSRRLRPRSHLQSNVPHGRRGRAGRRVRRRNRSGEGAGADDVSHTDLILGFEVLRSCSGSRMGGKERPQRRSGLHASARHRRISAGDDLRSADRDHGQVTAQAASEEIDDVEISRASDEAPEPDDDADADGAGAGADTDGAGAGADADGAGGGADAAGGESDSGGAGPNRDGTETSADEADTAADADGSTPAAVDAEAEGGEPGAGSESDAA